MSMSFRAGLAAVSLTVLGVVLGVAGDRLWLAHHQRPVTGISIDAEHAWRFRSLLDSLNVTDSQQVAIEELLGHFQGNVNQTWQSLQPRLQITMDSARQALGTVLNEEQFAAFNEWLAAEQRRIHGAAHTPFGH